MNESTTLNVEHSVAEKYNKHHWKNVFLPYSIFCLCLGTTVGILNTCMRPLSDAAIINSTTVTAIPFLKTIAGILLLAIAIFYYFASKKWSQKSIMLSLTIPMIAFIGIYPLFLAFDSINGFSILSQPKINKLISLYPTCKHIILSYAYLFNSLLHIFATSVLPVLLGFLLWSTCIQNIKKRHALLYFLLFLMLLQFGYLISQLPLVFINISHHFKLFISVFSLLFIIFSTLSLLSYLFIHKKALTINKSYADFHMNIGTKNYKDESTSIFKNKYFWIIAFVIFFLAFINSSYNLFWKDLIKQQYSNVREYISLLGKVSILKGGINFIFLGVLAILSALGLIKWYKITVHSTVLFVILLVTLLISTFTFSNFMFPNIVYIYKHIMTSVIFLLFPYLILTSTSKIMQTTGLMLILLGISPIMKFFGNTLSTFLYITFVDTEAIKTYYICSIIATILSAFCLIILSKKSKTALALQ